MLTRLGIITLVVLGLSTPALSSPKKISTEVRRTVPAHVPLEEYDPHKAAAEADAHTALGESAHRLVKTIKQDDTIGYRLTVTDLRTRIGDKAPDGTREVITVIEGDVE